jgi:hypothetical protein
VKLLIREFEFAGSAKCDQRGQTAGDHALRHTSASLMSRTGALTRVVQTRQATLNRYDHDRLCGPNLLEMGHALAALYDMPMGHNRTLVSEGT